MARRRRGRHEPELEDPVISRLVLFLLILAVGFSIALYATLA